MFNPLFTAATLLLLAATPGACDIPSGELTTPEAAKELASKLEAAKAAGILAEKVAHYQSLTDVVEKLGKGIGLGDSCLAHHLYMTGPLGISKATVASNNYASNAIKPTNYSEPVIAGLLAVAKADVYALKQMVETSTEVLKGLALLQADDAAAKAVAATMKTTIEKALKDNIKNAMATLAPVEEVIYALAQGNTDNTGGLKAGTSVHADAAAKLNTDAAKLAKETSTMIEGYFAALKTIGVTDGKELTGLKKIAVAATKADYGKTEALDGKDFFTPANAYQEAFVAYVKALLPTGTNDLTKLKLITEVNSVIGQVVATTTAGNGGTEAATLEPLRKAYVLAIGEKITDITTAAGDAAVICGRTKLTDIIPGLAATS